jgi:hypothetical protein
MSLNNDMEAAHKRDYEDQRKMRDLRTAIETFLADPPRRTHNMTLASLRVTASDLKDDEAHIVAVWD